jgi:5-methyltetrahydropteroyltriglutamate--homocysteine methyltransferase
MQRSTQRILTTHVGSLIRPAELLAAFAEPVPTLTAEARETLLAAAVEDVVKRQVDIGLDVVNDGEFGKSSWAAYVLERISGFEIRPSQLQPLHWLGRDLDRFPEFFAVEMPFASEGLPTEACVAPIEYRDERPVRRDIGNLRAALTQFPKTEAFMTVVAPGSTAYNGVNEFYASDRDYVFAIADALRREYRAVHAAGFLVQVDDAVLANMYDWLVRESPQRYREWAQLRVDALNRALEGIPADRVRYHVCFGSWHVPHCADAPLEALLDFVLQVNAQGYSLEAANVRHEHEWRVWKDVSLPADKILIPGVVTHHTTTVEHPRLVADRIVRFAEVVGADRVIASTDCGFAQSQKTQRVHPSIMWAKLEALVEGARLASEELF